MKIFITTLSRIDKQTTLHNLKDTACPVQLVVQDHEHEQHRAAFPGVEVVALPKSIRTLGPTRKYLCGKFHREKIVLLDDDLTFYHRPVSGDWHLKDCTAKELDKLLAEVCSSLDSYAHVSISGREGNNTVSEDSAENTRYMRFLAYNTALFPTGLEIGRVDGMSDFDLNLQLLKRGKPSLVYFKYAQNHPGTQVPGGCTLQRTHQTHEDEIRRMMEWHGEFVRPRQKRNKTGGEFGIRTELTIYWKKAYESAQKKTPPV